MIVFDILIIVLPLIILVIFNNVYVSIGVLIFCIKFFYSPDKQYTNVEYLANAIYSPSQGHVRSIEATDDYVKLSLFLNIFDNHTQYFPINSEVIEQNVYKGKFIPAYEEHSINNERVETLLKSTRYDFTYKVIQITGLLTRRIKSFVEPKTRYKVGERLGFIVLGSRVDIIIPSKNVSKVLVREGDHIDAMTQIIELNV